ncbi:tetratricopeptide repeat protein [Saccharopolyspora erythraea]
MVQAGRIDSVTFGSTGPGRTASAVVTPLPAASVVAGEVFVGRDDELARLLDALAPAEHTVDVGVGPVVVSAVSGMGGIGKTTLVRRAGAQAVERGWFPGGAVVVDLYGYDPDPGQRIQPGQVFGPLLRALGLDARDVPASPGEQAAVYHRVLGQWAEKERRVLVVLDNASTSDQVRDLLPRQGPHRVVVTTRDTLTLPSMQRLELDVLATGHALDLITRTLRHEDPSDPRVGRDPAGLQRVVELCDGLPLAVGVAAAVLADEPDLTAGELVEELEAARLPTLARGDTSVVAVLSLSWHRLGDSSPDAARLLRLIAMAPGPTLSTEAAAVLAEVAPARVRPWLRTLRQAHLLQQRPGMRWALHDLVRHHIREIGGVDTDAAVDRLLDFYTSTIGEADTYLRGLPGQPASGRFSGREEALAWLEAEQATLVAAVTHAATTGRHSHTTGLAGGLAVYLDLLRYHADMLTATQYALDTYRVQGDRHGEARAWNNLGVALRHLRRFDESLAAHQRSLEGYQELGDRRGEAWAWSNLGVALRHLRRLDEAIAAHQRALEGYQELGDRHDDAAARTNLGIVLGDVRRFDEAVTVHQQALNAYQESGDRHREAMVRNNLGIALRHLGRLDEAIAAHQRALEGYQEVGDRHGEARARNNLGVALRHLGRLDEAIAAHRQVLEGYQELGDRHGEAWTWNNVGLALGKLGRWDEAVTVHQQALEIYQGLGDRRGEAMAWGNLGNTLRRTRRSAEAIIARKQALEAYQELGDRQGEARTWHNLALALSETGQQDQAREAAERARQAYLQARDPDSAAAVEDEVPGSGRPHP